MNPLSSILIVGHPHPENADFGADHALNAELALKSLEHPYAVLVASDIEFLKKARVKWASVQAIYVNSQASPRDLQEAVNNVGVFKVLPNFEKDQLQTSVREALEEYELIQQNEALFKLIQEQNSRLQNLSLLLEERVKARQAYLVEARDRLLQATRRFEALHRTLIAIQRSLTKQEIEKQLNEALSVALGLQWTRILFARQAAVDEFKDLNLKRLAVLAVPLIRNKELLGHIYFARDGAQPFSDSDQDFLLQVSDSVGLAIDRLLALGAIEQIKREWDSAFDAITDPVALVSQDYQVLRANVAYASRANIEMETVIGKKCHEVLFQSNKPCVGCSLGTTFSLGDRQTADATFGHFDVTSHPVQLENSTNAYVLFYRDNIEEYRMRRQILESSKMAEIGTIGSSIAHEINNPLGGMIAFLQILKMEIPKEDPRYADIAEMESACQRCKAIVENLLAFARQSSSEEKTDQPIGELLDFAINLMELQTRSLGIRVNKHIRNRHQKIRVSRGEFIQVLVNVLQNSCEAIAERIERGERNPPGEITVNAFDREHDLGIEIIDNGTGIENDLLSKVFTPFFTTKNKTKNAGLGLTVSYQIMKELGGGIEISSYGRSGTTVVVTIPLSKPRT